MDSTAEVIVVPRAAAAQLALHARLAAHHAAAGVEPAAAEAVLAWAILMASGEAVADPLTDGLPTPSEIVDDSSALPAYRAAVDQAEQLRAHFDDEERFDLVTLCGRVVSMIEGEISRMT